MGSGMVQSFPLPILFSSVLKNSQRFSGATEAYMKRSSSSSYISPIFRNFAAEFHYPTEKKLIINRRIDMFKKLFITAIFVTTWMQASAQTLEKEYKASSEGNPISPCVFCADPTAIDYNGRLYVYGTNDTQQYIKHGKTGGNGYGDIKSLVIFSTDDMVNWTFHGTIDVGKLCSTWGWRFAASWAPSV